MVRMLGCSGWWVRCSDVSKMQASDWWCRLRPVSGGCCWALTAPTLHPHIHHSGSGLDWTGLKEYLNIKIYFTLEVHIITVLAVDTSIVLDFDIFAYNIEDRREMKCLNEVIFFQNDIKWLEMQFKHNFTRRYLLKLSTKLKQKKICRYSTINAVR